MPLALFKVSVTVVFSWGACARTFLSSDLDVQERMSSGAVRESLLAELKHAVSHGPGETKLLRLEAFFMPMYAALRKNGTWELKAWVTLCTGFRGTLRLAREGLGARC